MKRHLVLLMALVLIGLGPIAAQAQTTITLNASFNGPDGLAIDASGNIFVSDRSNNAVKKISPADGYATATTLGSGFDFPSGVAIDSAGNVFVADYYNNAVKEILAAGGYTTVKALGSGFNLPSGVAVDNAGNVFVADSGNNAVKEILAAGGYTTVRTIGSQTSSPLAVTLDTAGNVFFTGSDAQVYEILAAGGYTTTNDIWLDASNYSPGNFPTGIALDAGKNIYVADKFNDGLVKQVLAAGGYKSFNIIGTGFATPTGVAVDGKGNVFVCDMGRDAIKEVLAPNSTAATLTASAKSATYGQSVTFTAALVSGSGSTVAGSVNFLDGSTVIGSGPLTGGSASFTTAALGAGTHMIRASYAGNGTFTASNSTPVTETIGQAASATVVTSSLNPSQFGQSVTFTAAVSSANGAPDGTVTFEDGAAILGTGSLAGGSATFTTASLAVGSHGVTAHYAGNANFAASASGAVTQAVNPIPTASAIVSSIEPSNALQSVTFTVTVSGTGGTPTGTVTFAEGVTVLGTANLAGGTAAFATASLSTGSHMIGASYGGDADFAGSTASLTQNVIALPTVSTIVPSVEPSLALQSVTFTATVAGAGGVPTGSVTFTDGATTLGTVTLAAGTATFTTASLSVGSHSIGLGYSGDSDFAGSTASATQIVDTIPTTTALVASENPATAYQPVTFTATVSGAGGVPTGSVTFSDDSATLGTVPLAGGSASLTTAALIIGSHAITASFGGSTDFAASTSTALTETIAAAGTAVAPYSYSSTLGVTGSTGTDNQHYNGPAVGAVDPAGGHLFVADTGNHRVQIVATDTLATVATLGTAGVSGADNTHFSQPAGVGFDAASNRIFVADTGNQRIQIFDGATFAYLATIGAPGAAGADNGHFNAPVSAHVNSAKHQLYVADYGNNRVQIFNTVTSAFIGTLGTSGSTAEHLNQPEDAVLNPGTNQIMVADAGNARIQLYDAASFSYAATLGGPGGTASDNGHFILPDSLVFDPSSNLVLVGDGGANARVQVFDALTYAYVTTLGTAGSAGASNSQFASPLGIAADPVRGRLFVGDSTNQRVQIFSIAPPALVAAVLPGSRAVEIGHPATIFATMINASSANLSGCRIALPANAPSGLALSYQTTDSATNALIGTPDTPAIIAGNSGVQTFLVALQGSRTFSVDGMALDFACGGAAPASVVPGLDTVDLSLSGTPVADIIALAATASGNGIVEVPNGGAAAFAVATSNVGATAPITASVDTGTASLPVTATLCQSNPANGQCLATPAGAVTLSFASGAGPTFSVFVQATGPIGFAPGTSRVFVRFKDASGGVHGSTSVAIETQ